MLPFREGYRSIAAAYTGGTWSSQCGRRRFVSPCDASVAYHVSATRSGKPSNRGEIQPGTYCGCI